VAFGVKQRSISGTVIDTDQFKQIKTEGIAHRPTFQNTNVK
jgi:hypothetical protein